MRTALALVLALVVGACDDGVHGEPALTCPPAGPGGLLEGETLPDMTFDGCAEVVVSLHDLCGAPALIYHYAGWCPSCLHFLEDLPGLMAEADLEAEQLLILVSEDPAGAQATLPYCQGLIGAVDLPGVVALDPRGGDTSGLTIVVDAAAKVVLHQEDASYATVLEALSQ